MTIIKCSKILIGVGSLVALAILVAIGHGVMYFTAGLRLHCHPEVEKCNETNHLYHLETQQCLRAGVPQENICGNNMVIAPLPACPIQGDCECDYENNERHLVYDNTTHQCYPIYSQGPCGDGSVVTISSKRNELECRPDICVEEKSTVSVTERDLIVPYKNFPHLT